MANIAMLAGMTVSEKDVLQKAIEQKLCDTTSTSSALRGSTTALQQVALLKDFGISATVSDNFDVASVAKSIKEGKGVIVSVDRTLLEKNSAPVEPGYVAHADQSIVITGVSYSAVTNDVDAFYISDSGRGLTYAFAKGDGQDVLYDHDATKGNLDTLRFSDAKQNNLWLSKAGNDLRIDVLGTTDQVLVKDWYVGGDSGSDNHVERIKTADGKTLYDSDVDKLVQAMASFAPPAATQTRWPETAGGHGKVLLTISH